MTKTKKMLDLFYSEYFNIKAYVRNERPNNTEMLNFMYKYGYEMSEKNKNMLALFTFDFWNLGYTLQKPSKEYIINWIKRYEIKQ